MPQGNFGYSYPGGYGLRGSRDLLNVLAGTIELRIEPGAGNEFLVIFGQVNNADTLSRSATISVQNAARTETYGVFMRDATLAAGSSAYLGAQVTTGYEDVNLPLGPFTVSGTDLLIFSLEAVAAAQNAIFTFMIRCYGGDPTITEVVN